MNRLLSGLFLLALGSASFAQTQSPEKQTEIPKREEESQRAAAQAARDAAKRKAAGSQEVTWEDVMAHPDDIDLNYSFAQTQVRQGNLKGAAATLERLLLIDGSLAKVRLFYALVLYRLGDLDDAERELKTLKKGAMPESVRAEVDEYLALIEKGRRKTHVAAALSLGWGYDQNRNAAPSSGQRLFGDVPIPLTGNSLRQDDTDILGIGNVRVTRDLDSQAGHQIFGNFTYLRDEQTVVNYLDLQAYSAQIGGVYKTAFANFTPTGNFDHVLLSQQTFLRNRGGGLRVDRTLTSKLNGYLNGVYTYQDFVNNRVVPTAELRRGNQWETYVGGDYMLNATMKLGSSAGYVRKNAVAQFYAYDRVALMASHSWLLGKGTFLLSSLNVDLDYYVQPDTAISGTRRRDQTFRPRAVFGAPLGWICKMLDTSLFTLTYEYTHALSSVTNYAYTDNKIAGAFIYQFNY